MTLYQYAYHRFSSGNGDVQFFFVSTTPGLADVIMSPALRASSKRKSWISWRLGDAMVAKVVYSSIRWYVEGTVASLGDSGELESHVFPTGR